ncbi:MAG: hypothetical protein RLZZ609_3093 [Cyanobacteriota bacterium]|jgi:hypothetical protein
MRKHFIAKPDSLIVKYGLPILLVGIVFNSKSYAYDCNKKCEIWDWKCVEWKRIACPQYKPERFNSYNDPLDTQPMRRQDRRRQEEIRQEQMRQAFDKIKASRLFAAPGQYPPRQFSAYGIVAFQSLPVDKDETNRYLSICRGFISAIPASSALLKQGIQYTEQMVTVWPLSMATLANTLNKPSNEDGTTCPKAVRAIDLVTSRSAIKSASRDLRNATFDGRGPYVIAWSPAISLGKQRASVLVLDLSNVTTSAQSVEIFREWSDKIEQNPALWRKGWDMNGIRFALRLWADRWGPGILSFILPSSK